MGTDSVNHADSGDIKVFVQFPGNLILKISLRFLNCVGCIHMRGCFTPKNTYCIDLITVVIFIYKIKCNEMKAVLGKYSPHNNPIAYK